MTRRVSIKPGNMRDVSWIASNLRPDDEAEIRCQTDASPAELAAYHTQLDSYVACLDGRPAMAFGATPMTDCGVSVWAYGTPGSHRAVPEVTRFFQSVLIPDMYERGVRWAEARSIVTHTAAHRWMRRCGGEAVLTLSGYGKHGEDFILFRWTRDVFEGNGPWKTPR